ncbi:MAG: UDP-glucose 4-epimerase GalE [Firmicutes bacterium]|nr:UDP-glucose 4-epimerase GalE [Bacillota bacterium]
MSVLVTGGAGYVGSHAVAELVERGYDVVVADSLEMGGHREAVWPGAKYMEGNLLDAGFLDRVFTENEITGVMHFAASMIAPESMVKPEKYFRNNVVGTLGLLDAMLKHDVERLVFSSSACVYGDPESVPLPETARTVPLNPYGESKITVERMLKWYDAAHGLKSVCLRYFNVAGAHISGKIGEDHHPETHIIPLIIKAMLKGEIFRLQGDDYDTPDGTCIRDYIHATDLADAHILAMKKLEKDKTSDIYNLGNSKGFSNRQIIEAVEKVSGLSVKVEIIGRRPGDSPVLVASSDKIKNALGWKPKRTEIGQIVETAYRWHSSHPNGYN